MDLFLVEHYRPSVDTAGLRSAAAALRGAAAAMSDEGQPLRYVRSTIVPEDEAFFSFFEAESTSLLDQVHARAGVPYERISKAIPAELEPEGRSTDA